jgi:hypothetical protein
VALYTLHQQEEDTMIGTEKQIAYAKAILEGARRYNERMRSQPERKPFWPFFDEHIAAIDLILAVDRGDYAEARRLVETGNVPEWVDKELCLARRDSSRESGWNTGLDLDRIEEAVPLAGFIIDTFKRDFYAAKDLRLLDQEHA